MATSQDVMEEEQSQYKTGPASIEELDAQQVSK